MHVLQFAYMFSMLHMILVPTGYLQVCKMGICWRRFPSVKKGVTFYRVQVIPCIARTDPIPKIGGSGTFFIYTGPLPKWPLHQPLDLFCNGSPKWASLKGSSVWLDGLPCSSILSLIWLPWLPSESSLLVCKRSPCLLLRCEEDPVLCMVLSEGWISLLQGAFLR